MNDNAHAIVKRIFDSRAEWRAQRRTAALDALTPDRQALLREAAIMGFVQGHRLGHHPLDDHFSNDWIVATVLDACTDMDDLFPYIAGLMNDTSESDDNDPDTLNPPEVH